MSAEKILITGVTASGKGRIAFEVAKELDAEIVSVDSMKVYRRMDIGTAKPSAQMRREVDYHLVDVVEPSESFSVGAFLSRAEKVISEISARGRPVIAVGGTALYIKALLYGLFEGPGADEQIRANLRKQAAESGFEKLYARLKQVDAKAASRIHNNDYKRIIRALEVYELTGRPISSFQKQWDEQENSGDWIVIGLRRAKEEENRRVNQRVKRMIEAGLVDEVKGLLNEERKLSPQATGAIGYAEIIDYLRGRMPLDEAIEQIKKNTRRLAKNQRTWFRSFAQINWLDISGSDFAMPLQAQAGEEESSGDIIQQVRRVMRKC